MQRVASNFQMHANAGYNQSRDLVNQSIVLTFLLMFFVKTFLTSGSFNSELINKTVMGLNGLMLLYVCCFWLILPPGMGIICLARYSARP